MKTQTSTPEVIHGDLSCIDVEALMADMANEMTRLRDENEHLTRHIGVLEERNARLGHGKQEAISEAVSLRSQSCPTCAPRNE